MFVEGVHRDNTAVTAWFGDSRYADRVLTRLGAVRASGSPSPLAASTTSTVRVEIATQRGRGNDQLRVVECQGLDLVGLKVSEPAVVVHLVAP